MNDKRFKRVMNAVDEDLLEEARMPAQRFRKPVGIAAMAACFFLIVGGVMFFNSHNQPQDHSVQMPNPIQSVSVAEVEQLGYRIPLPANAQDASYTLITGSQDAVPMAQVSFLVNESEYTCRTLKTEQPIDISGIYQEWTETIDWAIGSLQLQLRKAADSAWVGWFSPEDGTQWCLSGDPDSVLHTAQGIVQTLGYQMAVAPTGAEQILYNVLLLDDLTVGETTFMMDGITYTYRTAATMEISDDFADISGLSDTFTHAVDAALSYCSARIAYNDGGAGKIVWFDPVPGLLYSVSMDSGASEDALTSMAYQLFSPAQGDVG